MWVVRTEISFFATLIAKMFHPKNVIRDLLYPLGVGGKEHALTILWFSHVTITFRAFGDIITANSTLEIFDI